jgi:hypothetical protein
MSDSNRGFDVGQFIGQLLKDEVAKSKEKKEQAEKTMEAVTTVASEETLVRVQHQEELSRRWYLDTAIRLMSDEKNSEGMNYSWQDLVIIAEKVRAYIEGGVFIDTGYSWQGVPKMTEDPTETLGN